MPRCHKTLATFTLTALTAAGCASDHKSDSYHNQRPAVDELNSRDRGLQSSEVVEASDLLVQKLLALPEVNQSSKRLTIVFDHLEDRTRSHFFDYDIFLERLKTNLAEQGRDRIVIVTNKSKYYGIRHKELDRPADVRDDRDRPALTNRVQADFALTGTVSELPNRGTDYYHFTFSLADIRADGGGTEIPMGYEVRVRR